MNGIHRLGNALDPAFKNRPGRGAAEVGILPGDHLADQILEGGPHHDGGNGQHSLKRLEDAVHGHPLITGLVDALNQVEGGVFSIVGHDQSVIKVAFTLLAGEVEPAVPPVVTQAT